MRNILNERYRLIQNGIESMHPASFGQKKFVKSILKFTYTSKILQHFRLLSAIESYDRFLFTACSACS